MTVKKFQWGYKIYPPTDLSNANCCFSWPDQHLSPYSGCRAWKPKFFIKIHLHWEWRVFVVWCSNGAHLKGFCLYFLSTIKFLKNPRFFVTKTVSNLSSLQTKVLILLFQHVQIDDCWKYERLRGLVKVSPNITSFVFWTTNLMKFSQKICYLRATFTKVSRATSRGVCTYPP